MAKRKADDELTPEPKRVRFLHGEIKTPPFSDEARKEAGMLLGRLQDGESFGMPHLKWIRLIGPRCGELRIPDAQHNWRIMFRVDANSILVVEVFDKKTQQTPDKVIVRCKERLRQHDLARAEEIKKLKEGGSNGGR